MFQVYCSLLLIMLACTACASRGHVPSYILTDSPETKRQVLEFQGEVKSETSSEKEVESLFP